MLTKTKEFIRESAAARQLPGCNLPPAAKGQAFVKVFPLESFSKLFAGKASLRFGIASILKCQTGNGRLCRFDLYCQRAFQMLSFSHEIDGNKWIVNCVNTLAVIPACIKREPRRKTE